MKSVKPGRGPSLMGGIMSIAAGLFGIIWTIIAFSIGGILFALFGIVFIVIAGVQAFYHLKNATQKNRYSAFDIVINNEEPDPLNQRFGWNASSAENSEGRKDSVFCPYCGAQTQTKYVFCKQCGRRL